MLGIISNLNNRFRASVSTMEVDRPEPFALFAQCKIAIVRSRALSDEVGDKVNHVKTLSTQFIQLTCRLGVSYNTIKRWRGDPRPV